VPGYGLTRAAWRKRAAIIVRRSLMSLSSKAGSVLVWYQGWGAAVIDAGGVVAVAGVPDDDQGACEQGERDCALDGACSMSAHPAVGSRACAAANALTDSQATSGSSSRNPARSTGVPAR
jgi:hypothetical protein